MRHGVASLSCNWNYTLQDSLQRLPTQDEGSQGPPHGFGGVNSAQFLIYACKNESVRKEQNDFELIIDKILASGLTLHLFPCLIIL
jgi:hypothetical protein